MTNNPRSDNGTLFTDISDYQAQLLSMAQHSSSPEYAQLCTPPPTPPPSPAADNGSLLCQDGLTVLPTQILKHPARLAIECYHRRKFSNATLPKATLYEYSRKVAEDKLSLQELYILSIFTLDVNASFPLTVFLQQFVQLSEPSVELSESECEELSDSFSPEMIHINRTTFCSRYFHFVGVELEEQAFKDKTSKLLDSLDYSFIAFLVAEGALEPLLELSTNLRHCAQPALESFYEEEKLHVPTEFIQLVLDYFSPLVLAILSLFTLDVTPSACRDASRTDMSIDERSLLGRSIQELRIDRILDQFLKQEPAKRERLESVRQLPNRLKLMFRNWSQCDVRRVCDQSVDSTSGN